MSSGWVRFNSQRELDVFLHGSYWASSYPLRSFNSQRELDVFLRPVRIEAIGVCCSCFNSQRELDVFLQARRPLALESRPSLFQFPKGIRCFSTTGLSGNSRWYLRSFQFPKGIRCFSTRSPRKWFLYSAPYISFNSQRELDVFLQWDVRASDSGDAEGFNSQRELDVFLLAFSLP